MHLDKMSQSEFWDLVYSTAKDKTRKKKLWNQLLSPEYVEVIINLADTHCLRIQREIEGLKESYDAELTDPDVAPKVKAYNFIAKIKGQAEHARSKHVAANKNVRKYAQVSHLLEYVEYLKDTIEDLRVLDEIGSEFFFNPTLDEYMKEEPERSVDDWVKSRQKRRQRKHG